MSGLSMQSQCQDSSVARKVFNPPKLNVNIFTVKYRGSFMMGESFMIVLVNPFT